MSANLQGPVARLWSELAVCGSGFVVRLASGRSVLLTCAHVLNQCLGRPIGTEEAPDAATSFSFDLPFVDRSRR